MRYDVAQINAFDLTRYPDYRGDLPPDVYQLHRFGHLEEYEAEWGRRWGANGIGRLRDVIVTKLYPEADKEYIRASVDTLIESMWDETTQIEGHRRARRQEDARHARHGRARKTVLFITHSIDEAVFLSDRVVVMTLRPGGVREILDIELPRPRTLHVRAHPRFVEYVARIRDLIFTKS